MRLTSIRRVSDLRGTEALPWAWTQVLGYAVEPRFLVRLRQSGGSACVLGRRSPLPFCSVLLQHWQADVVYTVRVPAPVFSFPSVEGFVFSAPDFQFLEPLYVSGHVLL